MKFVRYFDEQWYEDLIVDFERCFKEIWNKLHAYNNNINTNLNMISPTPVQETKGMVHPFPLAQKVYEIFQWLEGKRAKLPTHIEETLDEIFHLAYYNPFIDYTELAHEIEWERWKGMYTGVFYVASTIAFKLHSGKSINATEMAFMLHLSQVAVLKQIKAGKIPAKKEEGMWRIEASSAKEWINQYIQENPFDNFTLWSELDDKEFTG